jgi:hypothetical protein
MPVVVRPATASRAMARPRTEESPIAPTNRLVQGGERPIPPVVRAQEPDRPAAVGSDGHPDRDRPPSGAPVDRRPPSALGERRATEVFRPAVTPAIALLDAGRAQAADEPTIQVTIGRVEIRATVAPAPARKPAGRPPAMSLDEYLKQRNEAPR